MSDTPTECVTQCANVPSLKQNTRHHANHALSRICAWNQMWYHLHLRATLFHNYTIKRHGVCLHWRLLVTELWQVDLLSLPMISCLIHVFICVTTTTCHSTTQDSELLPTILSLLFPPLWNPPLWPCVLITPLVVHKASCISYIHLYKATLWWPLVRKFFFYLRCTYINSLPF